MLDIKKFFRGIRFLNNADSTQYVELQVDDSFTGTKQLNFPITGANTGAEVVVTDATQTLSGKSIDADTNTITNIENADIKAGANIAKNKLAAGTANRVEVTDGSGFLIESTVTTTELNLLSGLTGNITTSDNVQTLTNKTIDGDDNTIQDLALTSLKTDLGNANTVLTRDGSGVVVSTKASPSGDFVGTTDSQVLTNKTIDADLNTISNIENADIKTGAAIDATKIANGTVSNTEFQYLDGVTSAIQTQLDGKANTSLSNLASTAINTDILPDTDLTHDLGSASLRFDSVFTEEINGGAGDITINPSATGRSLVQGQSVQLSDGATSDPTGQTKDIYYNTASNKYRFYNGTAWQDLGSGSGTGVNYIPNPDAETDTVGWVTYADAAGPMPVNGTGGSPSVTLTRSTSSPLNGDASFVFTKPASNTQGEGFSADFTIDSADQAKVLQIGFNYIVDSGTFVAGGPGVDSDLTVWIYDITNAVIIQPSTYKLFSNSTSVAGSILANFQSASNSTDYRLIVHCGTTSALAYTLKFDAFSVSPTQYALGTLITDWMPYTPTFTGLGTVASIDCWYRREGSNIRIQANFDTGSVTATTAEVGLPNNLKVSSSYTATISRVGSASTNVNGALPIVVLVTPNGTGMNFSTESGGISPLVAQNGNSVFANATAVSLFAEFPIEGWSTQLQQSDVNDQRIVGVGYYAGADCDGFGQPINFSNKIYDTHSAVTASPPGTGAWRFTAPISGLYRVSGVIQLLTGSNSGISLYKNGSVYSSQIGYITNNNGVGEYNASLMLNAGDYIHIEVNANVVIDGDASLSGANVAQIYIERVANPAQISSTETVAASYYCSTNQSADTTTPANFDTKEIDTHGSVTTGSTWKFTAPISGIYSVSVTTVAVSDSMNVLLYKNGSAYRTMFSTLNSAFLSGTLMLKLNAGDYIDIRPNASKTFAGNAAPGSNCYIDILKVGI